MLIIYTGMAIASNKIALAVIGRNAIKPAFLSFYKTVGKNRPLATNRNHCYQMFGETEHPTVALTW